MTAFYKSPPKYRMKSKASSKSPIKRDQSEKKPTPIADADFVLS